VVGLTYGFMLGGSVVVEFGVGAVELMTGNMRYFDTGKGDVIKPEHIMASGALPPGLPPITIDGAPYWDGGLVSNTPLQYVLDVDRPRPDMCVFQIDLFSAHGPMPKTLFDVWQREKDIRYSSRTRLNTDVFEQLQSIRRAIQHLGPMLPDKVKATEEWKMLSSISCDAAVTIVHLIHRLAPYSTHSNDYEFSRYSVDEHWHDGRDDVERTLRHTAWKNRKPPKEGVTMLDCTRSLEHAEERKRA
ncbi:MAG TPA: patatin-like phospholipase family protein, partial [Planctomycetes bacterium]|nr:patatin-like phospholipase family protein [Planctomycetota bacterium]